MSSNQTVENALYPFFWLHGEDDQTLLHYMDKIEQSGMKGVCLEARPHPEFIKEGWWHDLDLILAAATQKQMKVWILDDSHFPTGYADGQIKAHYPQYLKQYLAMRRYDVHGPQKKIRIHLPIFRGRIFDQPAKDEKVMRVLLAKRTDLYNAKDLILSDSLLDITNRYDEEKRELKLDLEAGEWSFFVLYTTSKGDEKATEDYLNPLVKEATQVLIDTVYEPHYAHYADLFGNVIEGFFSDEPRFGNVKGTEAKMGTDMPLPWRPRLEQSLPFDLNLLPLLFVEDEEEKYREVRVAYMDLVTKEYNENFTKVLADWCHAHHVKYLGHTIEDNGAHTRLGYGTGHYFRGQQDMDFAGVDVIGTQIVPGMDHHHDAFSTGGANGEFYHYALAKLASSAAHLDQKKQGRAMCEAFGAYGWNEGLRMMKWIADSLMVRGINYIVPHAFDPKEFPDWDCPPHFYAHGKNPQFEKFPVLMDYINRITSIFKNGTFPASVAVLYPAEMEWAGHSMPIEKPCRTLTKHQIPFDIVTLDYLEQGQIEGAKITINQTAFDTLIIPDCDYIPVKAKEMIHTLKAANIHVIHTKNLEEIGKELASKSSIRLSDPQPDLVVGDYEKEGWAIKMLFNENTSEAIEADADFNENGPLYQYDPMINEVFKISDDGKFHLTLHPEQTMIYFYGKELADGKEKTVKTTYPIELKAPWTLSFATNDDPAHFEPVQTLETLTYVSDLEGYEQECGIARYETTFDANSEQDATLFLGDVQEIAEVFVNGTSCGTRICHPFVFDIKNAIKPGQNELRIEVRNSLGTKMRDAISHYLPILPFGLKGKITLEQNR